ncbi:MAG TPA: glycosyl hydrolase [Gemmatimonadaceae bacterium]|nr:glycosyl hydrolase [Gemmatimonadaceae bacterium]
MPALSRLALLVALASPTLLTAQAATSGQRAATSRRVAAPTRPLDSLVLGRLRWREIGPFRGGRSVAVAGSRQRPNEYWMGTVGGGVFKTLDGGASWGPVTDRWFGGSIGAIEVAPSNPDIVYVGGGEYPIRGNTAHGDGLWKTIDGGRTWQRIGLDDSRHIADVVVHPENPDIVWVGVLGHVFGPSPERGVYKSTDGGKSWRRTLAPRNDSTGVTDLVIDPNDANVLYAAMWEAYRRPWLLNSGGAGSGIYKSTDGGEHWTEITRNPGLPALGPVGNIGLAVSPADSRRVWAIVEHDSGGVFRSDDGGGTWTRTNSDRALRQRAWYYSKIHADPKDTNVVYVNNVAFHKSTNGGRTFTQIRIPHSDSHDLWIAPDDPQRMIEANDGGANVSRDGGRNWTEQDFATAQFYHVITTNHFPYQVCGAQQDNSTLCGPSRGDLTMAEWKDAGGGESGYIAPRWDDPDVVYAGSYGGLLTRKDMRTGLERNVNPWPDNPMGHPARDLAQRFQWTFPIVTSRHAPDVVYATSQMVHRSTNGGQSWTRLSGDLTHADPATLGNSGGPITRDQTSVEYYATIFAFAESPVTGQVLWAGSDDGRVHVSRDGGRTWADVTPRDMQKFTRVSIIDASPHAAGTAYVAANRYQLDDFKPYLWKTKDFGRTWTRIDAGIAPTEFTRAIREDDVRPGLLYVGTERGVWVSLDDGARWQRLQLNLPPVPVHDLAVKEGDLVAGTHGRSFWILDDLSVLRQASDAAFAGDAHLFTPRDAHRVSFGGGLGGGGAPAGGGAGMQNQPPGTAPVRPTGQNPPGGATVHYWLARGTREVTLEFLDAQGRLVRRISSSLDSAGRADSVRRETQRRSRLDSLRAAGLSADSIQRLTRATSDAASEPPQGGRRGATATPRATNRAGLNSFTWNMRYPDASSFQGMIFWAAGVQGPMAPPGTYQVRLLVDGRPVGTERFRLLKDPRTPATSADLAEQFRFLVQIRDRVTEANDAVKTIRHVKRELGDRRAKLTGAAQQFAQHADLLSQQLSVVEDSIYQTKNQSGQDPLNYPIRLNNKLAALLGVVGSAEARPTQQSYDVYRQLSGQLDRELANMKRVMDAHLPAVNAALRAAGQPEIVPRAVDAPPPEPMRAEEL